MALKLLQPNLVPSGQFDLHDDYSEIILGGECALLEAALIDGSDAYASDVAAVGPRVSVILGKPGKYAPRSVTNGGAARSVYIADEGTTGYGTTIGMIIGGTAGQGTGFGTESNTGVITVSPRTSFGSGKCTLFSAHGIYGITEDVMINPSALVTNDLLSANGGHSAPTSSTGDGKWKKVLEPTSSGAYVDFAATAIGFVNDSSLVSTTFTHASGSAGDAEYYAIYFFNGQHVQKH